MTQIIKKPVISEKSFRLSSGGIFSFLVDRSSDKPEIKKSIEEIFKVNVISISTYNIVGKIKKVRGKKGRRQEFKKALVRLKPNQKIDLFQTEEAEKEKQPSERKVPKKIATEQKPSRFSILGRKLKKDPTSLSIRGKSGE